MMTDVERHAREIEEQGYTIVEDVLTLDEVERARTALARILEAERDVGTRRGWQNDSWRVSYMLPQKDELFRRMPLNPRVLPLMRRVLGESCVLSSLNGLTMSPGGTAQQLHLDQPEHMPQLAININALHTLDDFTKANGCTRVVPGSHHRAPGTPIDRDRDERDAVYLEAPAGSLIAFNGGLVHAGSANTTPGWRRCLHAYFTRVWAKPQWDFPRSLSADVVATLSEEQKRLFGFGVNPQRYHARADEIERT
jgi:ectoine hydroxylase-related dioxygenase (phytanoyl-CoA dioxygenase family)